MITLLIIENIILIEFAKIPFKKGLNILSGETGAGKTAIMQALKLIAGEKGDVKYIRHNALNGCVEAEFEFSKGDAVWSLLESAGFDCDPTEPLIIRRELTVQGKTRIFINQKMASLSFLKELGGRLFDIASQHASQKLGTELFQRESLDSFADLEEEVNRFSSVYVKELSLKEELHKLEINESNRLREIDTKTREIEEIESARLDPDEDELLFKEYSELASSEERSQAAEEASNILSSLPLAALKKTIQTLASLDPEVAGLVESITQSKLELDELQWEINRYQEKIIFSPDRMACLDERLKLISRLKKKYGSTISDILAWKESEKSHLKNLNSLDERIYEIKEALNPLVLEREELSKNLTEKRLLGALLLADGMTRELQLLNMEKAQFFVEVTSKELSRTGGDKVTFYFIPNLGGKKMTVKDAASGGELARIFLALKTLLAKKVISSSLIFDEVDANIGGNTARLLGEKLASLGENTQVIAITHFPQVAAFAQHHLRVVKKELNGEVKSIVECLEVNERTLELARMVGKS